MDNIFDYIINKNSCFKFEANFQNRWFYYSSLNGYFYGQVIMFLQIGDVMFYIKSRLHGKYITCDIISRIWVKSMSVKTNFSMGSRNIYIYIYIYSVCVCVCVCGKELKIFIITFWGNNKTDRETLKS